MPQDRTVSRLEELEQGEDSEGKQFLQVTQKEYVKHIETMHNDLITAWNHEDRVRTLKIAIQVPAKTYYAILCSSAPNYFWIQLYQNFILANLFWLLKFLTRLGSWFLTVLDFVEL